MADSGVGCCLTNYCSRLTAPVVRPFGHYRNSPKARASQVRRNARSVSDLVRPDIQKFADTIRVVN